MDALFWEDAWKQLPRLADQPSLLRLQAGMTTQNKTRVAQYWVEETTPSRWRKWIPFQGWSGETDNNLIEGFLEKLNKRKIHSSEKQDRLRWGNNSSRTFSMKEAYEIATKHNKILKLKSGSRFGNKVSGQKSRPSFG
jgi:hypothetical protein